MVSQSSRLLHDERGSLTITTAAIIGFLAMVVVLAVGVASHTVVSHKARNAADMAAVAGAFAHYRGEGGCQKASDVAMRNGAQLTQCSITEMDVQVEVTINRSTAHAKAGPI